MTRIKKYAVAATVTAAVLAVPAGAYALTPGDTPRALGRRSGHGRHSVHGGREVPYGVVRPRRGSG
ncbi:hypothetical protein [Streptomyces odonnellii]|uniref:hypothetical protein n=1 Tax=Streptomyces odonnellii TaxID=1417980 RepID=UPI000697D1DA|nr:hypothetical protein [Streptomyces odonnellii]